MNMPTEPQPRPQPKFDLSLSVFFPCYNEEGNVERVARRAAEVLGPLVREWEVILVNDGSKDRTGEIADRLVGEVPGIRAVHHQKNSGYGAALRTGFKSATKDYVFFSDGDGQFDIAEIEKLLELRDQADIISGYRAHRQDSFMRRLNAACWGKLVRWMLSFQCRDVDCAFKLFKRKMFEGMELKSTGALINAEILGRAARMGYTVKSIPVTHLPRIAGQQTGAKLSVIFRAFKELRRLRKDIRRTSKGTG
jgi:glycosyltransferase involved in cell wall biosynthesis